MSNVAYKLTSTITIISRIAQSSGVRRITRPRPTYRASQISGTISITGVHFARGKSKNGAATTSNSGSRATMARASLGIQAPRDDGIRDDSAIAQYTFANPLQGRDSTFVIGSSTNAILICLSCSDARSNSSNASAWRVDYGWTRSGNIRAPGGRVNVTLTGSASVPRCFCSASVCRAAQPLT